MKALGKTDKDLARTLAQNLRRAREKAGLRQRDVAKEIDTSEMQISRWEKGTAVPYAISLARMASLYRVSMDTLFVQDHPTLPETADEKRERQERMHSEPLSVPSVASKAPKTRSRQN